LNTPIQQQFINNTMEQTTQTSAQQPTTQEATEFNHECDRIREPVYQQQRGFEWYNQTTGQRDQQFVGIPIQSSMSGGQGHPIQITQHQRDSFQPNYDFSTQQIQEGQPIAVINNVLTGQPMAVVNAVEGANFAWNQTPTGLSSESQASHPIQQIGTQQHAETQTTEHPTTGATTQTQKTTTDQPATEIKKTVTTGYPTSSDHPTTGAATQTQKTTTTEHPATGTKTETKSTDINNPLGVPAPKNIGNSSTSTTKPTTTSTTNPTTSKSTTTPAHTSTTTASTPTHTTTQQTTTAPVKKEGKFRQKLHHLKEKLHHHKDTTPDTTNTTKTTTAAPKTSV
jgi:hypothetical protein